MHMTTHRLQKVLVNLRLSCDTLPDGQLLARFVAGQDEAAFAALVRRHGPMVLGVCRRVLRHSQDAEDVFQATFLILARKASSVLKREAIGSWLYRVAYRAAQEARVMRARRRAQEKPEDRAPQPSVKAAEVQDWRPILDQELSSLPEKYQAAIVLCDLEARPRKEAARQIGIAEGTLSSRLANGRKLLAARLRRRGVTLAGGALAAALSEGALTAHVPGALVCGTAKAAVLVAVGQLAAVSPPVAVLMKGVLKTMFIAKLKTVADVVALAVLTLGFGSAAYQTVGAQNVPGASQKAGKPLNEVEALRRENELLKLNLQVVLEKLHAQEVELRTFRHKAASANSALIFLHKMVDLDGDANPDLLIVNPNTKTSKYRALTLGEALKRAREATSEETRREAFDALELAVQRMKELEQTKKVAPNPK